MGQGFDHAKEFKSLDLLRGRDPCERSSGIQDDLAGRMPCMRGSEVVTSDSLSPRAAPQSLRVPPACGCPPVRNPVRVIGWDARKLPFASDC